MSIPPLTAHAFVDGGHLRSHAEDNGLGYLDPWKVASWVVSNPVLDGSGFQRTILLPRVNYYDAEPDEGEAQTDSTSTSLESYWQAVEALPCTHLRFGELRGKPRRQKGVDVLLAVDMLVGAVDHLFDAAVLVTGDADFAPVVREVQRRGMLVFVASDQAKLSQELRRSADQLFTLECDETYALEAEA
jgi:uncharacterized LabA/DUF88 family protein